VVRVKPEEKTGHKRFKFSNYQIKYWRQNHRLMMPNSPIHHINIKLVRSRKYAKLT
jgi:hypothetical protein